MRKSLIVGSGIHSSVMMALLAGTLSPRPAVVMVDHIEAPAMSDESLVAHLMEGGHCSVVRRTMTLYPGCSTSTSTSTSDHVCREILHKRDARPFYARLKKRGRKWQN